MQPTASAAVLWSVRPVFLGLMLCAALLSHGCGRDDGNEPGTELGPCVGGQFCASPLQCVEQVCVHPDQLHDTAAAEHGAPTIAERRAATGNDPTEAARICHIDGSCLLPAIVARVP